MHFTIVVNGYPYVLEGFSDASWITNSEDRSSTSGWIFTLGGGAVSWGSKKQTCIPDSTMAVEFVTLVSAKLGNGSVEVDPFNKLVNFVSAL